MSDITIISNAEWLADIFETERLITLGEDPVSIIINYTRIRSSIKRLFHYYEATIRPVNWDVVYPESNNKSSLTLSYGS